MGASFRVPSLIGRVRSAGFVTKVRGFRYKFAYQAFFIGLRLTTTHTEIARLT